jgi:hypothetical protein
MVGDVSKRIYNVSFNIFDALKELEKLDTNTRMPHELAWPIYPIDTILHLFDDP